VEGGIQMKAFWILTLCLHFQIKASYWADGMAQAVERLPNKHKILSSVPSSEEKKNSII
jgi:hypothetical protein